MNPLKSIPAIIRSRWRLALAFLAVTTTAAVWLRCGPLPQGLLDGRQIDFDPVVDREGTPLYEARADGGVRSVPMDADTIPPFLAQATVAAEDRRYWSHPGVDPLGVFARSGGTCARAASSKGSTLTQQTAKLLLARQAPAGNRGSGPNCRNPCWRCGSNTASTSAKSWRCI